MTQSTSCSAVRIRVLNSLRSLLQKEVRKLVTPSPPPFASTFHFGYPSVLFTHDATVRGEEKRKKWDKVSFFSFPSLCLPFLVSLPASSSYLFTCSSLCLLSISLTPCLSLSFSMFFPLSSSLFPCLFLLPFPISFYAFSLSIPFPYSLFSNPSLLSPYLFLRLFIRLLICHCVASRVRNFRKRLNKYR